MFETVTGIVWLDHYAVAFALVTLGLCFIADAVAKLRYL